VENWVVGRGAVQSNVSHPTLHHLALWYPSLDGGEFLSLWDKRGGVWIREGFWGEIHGDEVGGKINAAMFS